MIQLRRHPGFSQKPLLHRFVFNMLRGEHLDGDYALKLGVVRFKDLAHTARAKRFSYLESSYVSLRLDQRRRHHFFSLAVVNSDSRAISLAQLGSDDSRPGDHGRKER